MQPKLLLLTCFACMCSAAAPTGDRRPTEGYLPRFSRRVPPAIRQRLPLHHSLANAPGLDRFPATFGVPFPRGALKSADHVRVLTAGDREVPAVVRRTATWEHPDGDVQWIRVDCPLNKGQRYWLEFGTGVRRSQAVPTVKVDRGAEAIVVDTGPLRLTFSKRVSTLIAAAELHGTPVLPAGSQRPMSLVDEQGRVAATSDSPEDYRIQVEQAGPLHCVIRASGWYRLESGEGLCQYTTRVHAYAGEAFVRVVHTFVVAYDTDKVRLRDIAVPFVLDPTGEANAAFGTDAAAPLSQTAAPIGAHLIQDHHKHFTLRGADAVLLGEGARAAGWFDLSGPTAGLAVGLRHMWQEYPKELETQPGAMVIHLWPAHGDRLLDFGARGQLGPELYKQWDHIYWRNWYKGGLDRYDQAMGVAKTNELVLAFHAGDRRQAVAQCTTLERPVWVWADPEWMCKSDVFGRLSAVSPKKSPQVEHKIAVGFERFEHLRRHMEDYGMIHYGDVHYVVNHDKDNHRWVARPWRCWASRFYGFPLVCWTQFVRTGSPRHLMFGMDNAKHVMDVDMSHVTDKAHGKRRGGRYGGNGGIIHYGGNMYDIGCDTHVQQLLYAYYLLGYRRAWDVLMEEAEDFLWLDENNASGHLRRYAHRMTGGSMRAFIALYRATWDERFLALARRLADHCYENQSPDGTIRYDDVYMAPGLFTYYQATGDRRMLELFLRCMRKQAQTSLPMSDPRAYSFYGPAMAYFTTDDPSYLARSVKWMSDFAACIDENDDPFWRGHTKGYWDYCHLTVHTLYMPYLIEALSTCSEAVEPRPDSPVTGGSIVLRRPTTEPFRVSAVWGCYSPTFSNGVPLRRWEAYCKRYQPSARLVVTDPQGREAAAQPFPVAAALGEVAIEVPPGPPGDYRLSLKSDYGLPLKLNLMHTSLDQYVFDVSQGYVAFGERHYFMVPKGRTHFALGLKAQALRCKLGVRIFAPDGKEAATWEKDLGSSPLVDHATIEWDVPKEQDGQCWSLCVTPGGKKVERVYLKFDGPAYVAPSPATFFIPRVEPPREGRGQAPEGPTPPPGKRLALGPGHALLISRGRELGEGRYERLSAKEGTIEFWLKADWDPHDLRDRGLLSCGGLRAYRRGAIGTYVLLVKPMRQSGFVLSPKRWHHVAIVWTMEAEKTGIPDARLFVDGVAFGQFNWAAQGDLGDWTAPDIRLGSERAIEVDDVRISGTARYSDDFSPAPLGEPDRETLAQLKFEGDLPAWAKVNR